MVVSRSEQHTKMYGLWIALSGLLAVSNTQMATQNDLDAMADNLQITWLVVTNTGSDQIGQYQVEIILKNQAPTVFLDNTRWQIRFFSSAMLETNFEAFGDPHWINVTHLQGSLYAMEPTDSFVTLEPGVERKIKLKADRPSVARSDVMGHWYLVAPGLRPRVINSTTGDQPDFVADKTRIDQWKRSVWDEYNPYTVQERYERNYIPDAGDDSEIRIIPKPLHTEIKDLSRTLTLDNTWRVSYGADLRTEASLLIDLLNLNDQNSSTNPISGQKVIELQTGQVDLPQNLEGVVQDSPEAYALTVSVTSMRVTIRGQGAPGVVRALASLQSLKDDRENRIPESYVVDAPRFEYRGLMLDISSNFRSRQEILDLLQTMARYKLNRLHLRLAADVGWRLEIPALPELTQIGSKRCHDDTETQCLLPQLGSGPDSSLSFSSGYLLGSDYQQILRQAAQFHIEIVPEINMPSNSRAAVKAMEYRHQRLTSLGRVVEAAEFRLVEENDTSQYLTQDLFTDGVMNPCLNSTYSFVEEVLDELIRLHSGIQTLTHFHFGNEDVPANAWKGSQACNAIRDSLLPFRSAHAYFYQQLSRIALSRGIAVGVSEYGTPHPFTFDENRPPVYATAWNNNWDRNVTSKTYDLANSDYKVILGHATHLYLDHAQEPDPHERGRYWAARFEDTQKTFSYNAFNVYANTYETRFGEAMSEEEKCGAHRERCPSLVKPKNIVGMEAALFTDVITTKEQMDSQLFPRLLAVAERAWHQAPWEDPTTSQEGQRLLRQDWQSFVKAVGHRELRRLEADGVKYRIPPPGAIVYRNHLLSTALYPGLTVQHSLDQGNTWREPTTFVDLTDHKYRVWLRTRSFAGDRYSRVVVLSQDGHVPVTNQKVLDYMAHSLSVQFTVEDNFKLYGNDLFLASVTITNNENTTVPLGNWAIYFTSVRLLEPDLLKLKKRYVDSSSNMYIAHVQGYQFKMGPTSDFKGLAGYDKLTVSFRGQYWSVSRYDQMPNWYVAALGMTAKNIQNTEGETLSFVSDFDTPDQWKRFSDDLFDPWTPASRYDRNKDMLKSPNNPSPILPTPMTFTLGSGHVDLLNGPWVILYDVDSNPEMSTKSEATYIKDTLKIFLPDIRVSTRQSNGDSSDNRIIKLKFGNVAGSANNQEAYKVDVEADDTITISAPSKAGIFYGGVSFIQLAVQAGQLGQVPVCQVKDWPRFAYRGMHVDTARNFQEKETVLRLLDVMALYKLNKLHLHLTDDEGWRLEIPGLEELTRLGGQRCHDLDEQRCIMSTLGSGANVDETQSAFYNVTTYQGILAYANQRHVQVIPEFDFPGHAHAAIKAMRYRRQHKSDSGYTDDADEYLLDETNDPSDYLSVQYYDDNAVNPCVESTYRFMAKVVEEVKAMHQPIQPLTIFHFGGDEVARGAWTKSESCIQLRKSGVNLKEYFTQRMSQLTQNLTLAAWEDGLMDHGNVPWNRSVLRNERIIAQAWQNVWEWGSGARPYYLANAGYQVVLSPVTHNYFDHPQEPSSEERGFYWGTRYTDAFKTFSFLADDFYRNIAIRRSGQPITKEEVCKEDKSGCPSLEKPENIIGLQGQLWSETVRKGWQFDAMVFPRLLSLSERAWHKGMWEEKTGDDFHTGLLADWSNFANMMGSKHLKLLDKLGVAYRVAPPGARQSGRNILANMEYPGLTVQYKKGNSWTTLTSNISFSPPTTVQLRTVSSDGTRFSREVAVSMLPIPPKQTPDSSPIIGISTVLSTITAMIHLLFMNSF